MRAPVDGQAKGAHRRGKAVKNRRRSDAAQQLVTPRFHGFSCDDGEPNLKALATYIRLVAEGNSVLNMVADWLDPAIKRKPWGRKLVLKRLQGARKTNDDISIECLKVVDTVRELAAQGLEATGDRYSHKQIIGRVAKQFGISDARVRQHLAAFEEARGLVEAMTLQRRRR